MVSKAMKEILKTMYKRFAGAAVAQGKVFRRWGLAQGVNSWQINN